MTISRIGGEAPALITQNKLWLYVVIIIFRPLQSCFRWMWEMFESDYDFECDNECDGPGPPIFNLPPPPRPDFLQELDKCSENALSDLEMCEAIPVSWGALTLEIIACFLFVLWKHFASRNLSTSSMSAQLGDDSPKNNCQPNFLLHSPAYTLQL